MNQLPTILKKARQALDLTQEDVAKKLGISQRAYAFYEDEANGRLPKRKRMEDLGKVLHIPIKTLLKLHSEGIEENASTPEADQPQQKADTVLTGAHVTLQDYINKIDEHNAFLQYVIKNGLVSLEANLARGQQEIKEQILVTATAAVQQLTGQVPGVSVPLTTGGKGIGGKKKAVDGDGKNKDQKP